MSQEKNIEIVVLRTEGRFESDRRIIALTKEFGKQSFIAKGARKASSRLSALAQPFARAKVSAVFGKNNKFITQCELLNTHSRIRSDYNRLISGLAINELCLTICQFDKNASEEFELLLKILEALETHQEPKIVFLWGLLKFISLEGVQPHWIPENNQRDLPLNEIVYFSLKAGGMINIAEETRYLDIQSVPLTILITLDKLGKLDFPPPYVKNLSPLVCFLIEQSKRIFEQNMTVFDFLL